MAEDHDPIPPGRRRALTALFGGALALVGTGCTRRSGDLGLPDAGSPATTAPATEHRDPDLHLLRRLTFGATSPELDHLRSTGREAWLAAQLEPDALDTHELEAELVATFPELNQDSATTIAVYRADPDPRRIGTALVAATLVRHVESPAQLHERMVEFWSDHFNVPQSTLPTTVARIAMDRDVLRPHALGRFDELLVAVVQSPAMLLYLDNFRSSAGAINENHARELLELHTVGIGGGYDEDDVVATARLLTGWGIDRELEFRFSPARHDAGAVSILGWRRPTGGDPMAHGVAFLQHLARLPATAEFVCRKLAVRFVADEPTPAIVAAMAEAWLVHDTAIVPVIEAMVGHDDFFRAPPKFNRPWDHLVQSLRALDAEVDLSFGPESRGAAGLVRDLGQVPFRKASPDGYPDVEPAWANAGALLARWNTAALLADPDRTPFRSTALRERPEQLSGATATEIVDHLADRLRQAPLSSEHRALLGDLTGWAPDEVPDDGAIAEALPHIAFALLALPEALYR